MNTNSMEIPDFVTLLIPPENQAAFALLPLEHQFEMIMTLCDLSEKYGAYLCINDTDHTLLPSLSETKTIQKELRKMPRSLHRIIKNSASHFFFFSGRGITDINKFHHLKGMTPRGWPEHLKWDTTPGAGAAFPGDCTVVVSNMLRENHGSINLVLHEHIHTLEMAVKGQFGYMLSESPAWIEIHNTVNWKMDYLANSANESFCESFTQYLHSSISRENLDIRVKDYLTEILRQLSKIGFATITDELLENLTN